MILRGNFGLAFSYNTYYFLESICYHNSWKFYDFYLMYGYTWNLRKYNQMIVVIIVVKMAILYMRVKTILEIVVIVMTVAL